MELGRVVKVREGEGVGVDMFGQKNLGLASFNFSSTSLANPRAWVMDEGFRIANSFLMLVCNPKMKQLSRASGDNPKTLLDKRSN